MDLAVRAQKCVVFIGVRDPTYGTFTPLGTGFLVMKAEAEFTFQHIITARHVIDLIALDTIWVRINKVGGGVELLQTRKSHWHFVEKEKQYIDVAIMPCVVSQQVFDILHLDLGSAVIAPPADPDPPLLGDQICVVGLFTSHYGAVRNVPIARFGNVAAIPDDPVLTEFGYMSGYLVELKSLGGMSGSPVIVSRSNFSAAPTVDASPEPEAFLLGLMHGHFVIQNPEDAIQVDGNDKSTGQINTGIGLVIPAKHILEALDLAPVADGRKILADRLRRNSSVKADRGTPPTSRNASSVDPLPNDENATHREDFMRLVGAPARKPEPKD
jgi:hypothetical protein